MLIFIYYLFFYIFIKKKLYKNGVIVNLYSFKKIKLINETFTSFRDVSVYNLKNKLISNLEEINKTLSFAKFENSTISIASKYILEFIFIFILLLFGLINLFFFEKSFNNSIVYLIILVFAGYKIIPNFQDIFNGVSSLQSIKYTTEILKEQILLRPDTQNISSVQPLNTKTTFEDLVFKNVSFSYRERKNIFYDYNLTIKSGDRICIEGESGSGKSTLIDLLLGLAKCSSGEIILNGLNLNNKNIIQYHKIIGYVPQKIFLFDQSILENITLNSTSDYNSKQLDLALRMACLQDFIKDLPKGLNTKVGEIGSQISGGQAQRISIARAVYKDPQIYIFDEPTSSLNKEISETIISNFMRLNNKTIIISSHKTEEFKKYGYKIVKINN
jgi:ABC-type bacteriocin/lantibiotic exporter with double-glycine peptidase domain